MDSIEVDTVPVDNHHLLEETKQLQNTYLTVTNLANLAEAVVVVQLAEESTTKNYLVSVVDYLIHKDCYRVATMLEDLMGTAVVDLMVVPSYWRIQQVVIHLYFLMLKDLMTRVVVVVLMVVDCLDQCLGTQSTFTYQLFKNNFTNKMHSILLYS